MVSLGCGSVQPTPPQGRQGRVTWGTEEVLMYTDTPSLPDVGRLNTGKAGCRDGMPSNRRKGQLTHVGAGLPRRSLVRGRVSLQDYAENMGVQKKPAVR